MMRFLYTALFLCLGFWTSANLYAQSVSGRYDVRFVISGASCTSNLLYVDVQVRAANVDSAFNMADQNYKFTYNRLCIRNPRVFQELGFSATLPDPNAPALGMPYGPHSTAASINPGSGAVGLCILNVVWTPGRNGVRVTDNQWFPVSRIEFDIVDPTLTSCVNLTWRKKSVPTHFTNITEVQPTPPPGSNQTQSFTTTSTVAEGAYSNAPDCLTGICTTFLPVDWLAVQAIQKGKEAHVNWTVGMEKNNREFVVERAVDGQIFETIGSVNSLGDTESPRSYGFTDPELLWLGVNKVFYRITQIDYNGNTSRSNAVELTLNTGPLAEVRVYPNPTQDLLFVQYRNPAAGPLRFQLSDLSGKTIMSQTATDEFNTLRFDVSKLSPGMYQLLTITPHQRYTTKVVVQ